MTLFLIFNKTHRLKTSVKNEAFEKQRKKNKKRFSLIIRERHEISTKVPNQRCIQREILHKKNDPSLFLFLIKLSLKEARISCKSICKVVFTNDDKFIVFVSYFDPLKNLHESR